MDTMKDTSQTRRMYDPPAVVYETELEVHAASTSSTGTGSPVFDLLNLDK